ncbi:RUS1 family protein C16orf58 homolog [Periophthalmus magnuspinnatus]|uniref:RUS1 family protein C16orf58 homolog n=1 Tax=Periophthalmus magnuspinnatus TaxID=409849 RepID=UPI00145B1BEB|nr:RUS1 family protein C16orf58 homolog [Periophthalmus magnuspinnatus]
MSAGSGGLQLASERYGSGGFWNYRLEGTEIRRQREGPGGHTGTGLRNLFKSVFLPQGFPESVSTDYLQYQLWDTAQAFCSSLSGTLATQASLRGVGVGNQEATVAAATATWILRDGTGMLGRILFAWRKGTKLDSEAKKWRLFADVLNDIAMFMEILAQFFPTFFLLIICTAGVFKSIVGVAGGATRAALTVHQARRDNMADISAKDGSQETLVNLAGLLVSLLLIPLITDNAPLTLLLFTLFTVLHLVSNFKAVRAVIMETFNEARLEVVWQNFVQNQEILTPREANEMEPVFSWFSGTAPIRLGVSLQQLIHSPEEFERMTKLGQERRYLIGVRNGSVCVCLLLGASVRDEFKAMCHALSLRRLLSERHKDNIQGHWNLVDESQKLVEKYFDPFMKSLAETQWETNRNLLDWDEWRIQIKCKSN